MNSIEQAAKIIEAHIEDVKLDAKTLNLMDARHNSFWLLKALEKIPGLLIITQPIVCDCGPKCPFLR